MGEFHHWLIFKKKCKSGLSSLDNTQCSDSRNMTSIGFRDSGTKSRVEYRTLKEDDIITDDANTVQQ